MYKQFIPIEKPTGLDEQQFVVDLRSDTLTTPTESMRLAMSKAPVGDDVYAEDPTVKILEQRSAAILGKEAALFVPSGTMANLIAIMVHCKSRASEIIVGDMSHTFLYEQGGAAYIAGVQISTIKNKTNGTFCLQELKHKFRSTDLHEPSTSLIIVENTHNMCGGKVLPLDWLDSLVEIASSKEIPLHMDGARLFNAAEYLKESPARLTRGFASVCFCLSKGLGSPVGSILAGTKDFVAMARRYRKALGGGMRQVGVLAAAGLLSLDEIVPILGQDHKNAQQIAKEIRNLNGKIFKVDLENLHSNILIIEMESPLENGNAKLNSADLNKRLALVTPEEIAAGCCTDKKEGIVVLVSSRDWKFVRLVTYHQITEEHLRYAIKKIVYVLKELEQKYS